MLQLGGITGFQDLLNQLNNIGFFQYVLPFLLIFAIVYTLVTQIPTFKESKGAAVLIAVAIGLLSLQFNTVSVFFQILFPKAAIGLAILLIALILMGAFISQEKAYKWIFFGAGAIIFAIVMVLSFSGYEFSGNWWWQQYGTLVVVAIVVVVAMVMVILASRGKKEG